MGDLRGLWLVEAGRGAPTGPAGPFFAAHGITRIERVMLPPTSPSTQTRPGSSSTRRPGHGRRGSSPHSSTILAGVLLEDPRDRPRRAGGLDGHDVLAPQTPGEAAELVDPARYLLLSLLTLGIEDADLAGIAMDVHSDEPH